MSATPDLLELDGSGLYCRAGDFYIDPWRPVRRAIITHGHGDHARAGMRHYWTQRDGLPILYKRLGQYAAIDGVGYGEPLEFGPVRVSLHPAGHILGSAQVRIEHGGRVWVVSGDFKRDADPTCAPFEVVPCETFITEATFAYPVYRWPKPSDEVARIHAWWQQCREAGRPAVLYSYALGKAQRILAELAAFTGAPVLLHGAMVDLVAIYRRGGVPMVPTRAVSEFSPRASFAGHLVLAPPSAAGSKWARRFKHASSGFASGWMQIRGNRRRRGYDRGFVISDHADWPALVRTIEACGASQVLATHGHTEVLVQHLRERDIAARPLRTPYGDAPDADDAEYPAAAASARATGPASEGV